MYVLCICMYICKIRGTFYYILKNFKMSHPVVDGHLKMSHPVADCHAAVIVRPPPPPVEVLVRILYYWSTQPSQKCKFHLKFTLKQPSSRGRGTILVSRKLKAQSGNKKTGP